MKNTRSKTQSSTRGFLLVCMSLLVASCMALCGCSSGGSDSDASSSGNDVAPVESSDSSAAPSAGQISVNIVLTEDVTKATTDDSPLQFSEEQTSVNVNEGASAYDVLQATGREVATSGTGDDLEVTAIGGLANGDAGEGSHWECALNGEAVTASPAVVTVSSGDTVTFTFVH